MELPNIHMNPSFFPHKTINAVFFLFGIFLLACTPKASLQKLQKIEGVSEVRGLISLGGGDLLIFGREPSKTDPIRGDLSRARVVLVEGANQSSKKILDQIGDIISVVAVSGKNSRSHFYALNRRLVVLEATHQLAPVYQIFHTDDRGATWETVTVTEPRDPKQWPHLDFIDDRHGWLADNENWYRTDDGGESWTAIKNILPGGRLKKFVTLSPHAILYAKENRLIWADQNLATTVEVTLEASFRLVTIYRQGLGKIMAVGYDMAKKQHGPIQFEVLRVDLATRNVERGAFLPPNFFIEALSCGLESCFFAGSQWVAREIQERIYLYDFTKQNIKEMALPSRHAPPFLVWDEGFKAFLILQAYTSRDGSDFFLYKIINN